MHYTKEFTKEINFPLGGIGTGCVGFTGNGHLKDWEIFNRPAKGSDNGYSHLALRMKTASGVQAAVLNGDQEKDLIGQYGSRYVYSGFGYGPSSESMSGFRHFSEWSFDGEFPLARLNLADPEFPAEVTVTAFNPMIPNDAENSSIPAAFFMVDVRNTGCEEAEMTAAFSVRNPFEVSRNTLLPDGTGVFMKNAGAAEDDVQYGDLTLSAAGGEVFCVADWYRGHWQDNIATYWREFSSPEGLRARCYGTDGERDHCTVSVTADALPGETRRFFFVLSWNIPNNYNYWNPLKDENGKDVSWKNWYATRWENSAASNRYALQNLDSLYARTVKFHDALYASSLDPVMKDAAFSTVSVLHTPTVFRLENGEFYGWEGCREIDGSCEGSCTHVWNYAYALCFLFPELERSIRDLDFRYNLQENGAMRFRMTLPLGRPGGWPMPCVDGQMGGLIKLYRDWKLCGDDEWLKKNWPAAKKSLEFAWSEENPLCWDRDKDGVLEGRQHHTLDMELFGPSSWLESMYLAALRAGEEMAAYLGEKDSAAEYHSLYEKGCEWMEKNLFNGKYYIQKLDLSDYSLLDRYADAMTALTDDDVRETYWNSEVSELKYQIGEGCAIDQALGEWHAVLTGLGPIFDKAHLDTALDSMFENNFYESFRKFSNPWRNFYVNDESGAVMVAYPEGVRKPALPVNYTEETMHGFEYAFAGLLLAKGRKDKALRIIKGVRDRYDGKKRNPYNEIECGNNYARSMAAFAFLPITSGFSFDLPKKMIGFNPLEPADDFRTFWSVDGAWGTAAIRKDQFSLAIQEGTLRVNSLALPFLDKVESVLVNGTPAAFRFEEGIVRIDTEAALTGEIVVNG